jgi:hypothetical protein
MSPATTAAAGAALAIMHAAIDKFHLWRNTILYVSRNYCRDLYIYTVAFSCSEARNWLV